MKVNCHHCKNYLLSELFFSLTERKCNPAHCKRVCHKSLKLLLKLSSTHHISYQDNHKKRLKKKFHLSFIDQRPVARLLGLECDLNVV